MDRAPVPDTGIGSHWVSITEQSLFMTSTSHAFLTRVGIRMSMSFSSFADDFIAHLNKLKLVRGSGV